MKNKFSSFSRSAFLLAFLFVNGFLFAQSEHAKWTFSVNPTGPGEAELVMKADVEKGWHIFALVSHDGDDGSLPTEFTFAPNPNYELAGGVIETQKPIKRFEEGFGTNSFLFLGSVTWKQKIKLKTTAAFSITGEVNAQTCAEGEGGMCVLVYSKMNFNVPASAPNGATGSTGSTGSTGTTAPTGATGGTGAVGATGSTGTVAVMNPCDTCGMQMTGDLKSEIEKAVAAALAKGSSHPSVDTSGCNSVLIKPTDAELTAVEEDKSIIGIFIAGFIGGLIALLTPCVFPMIPLTVSFFTKRSKTRQAGIKNAFLYAISIIVIYVGLGMIITASLGASALNEMASSALFNLLFFFVFILFAISFLGAFEITLPSRFINKVDSASDRGGLIGIFFMAFTLSLVSFSCTGPIIGTLLVEAARGGGYFGPAVGMFGFALALALPFALFAMFPGWLNSLPKSGGWLNSVKVTLGFVEIALALKFLSTVDLAYHWGILKREVFLAIWIIDAILLGLYLIGKLRLSHDSEMKHVSTTRVLLAMLSFTFAAYLIPGMFGAPTTFVSGYLPPNSYREWKDPKSTECPQDLSCFHDLKEALCYAKSQGKPVFIDFTGYSCVNCRKMEDKVWSDPTVYKHLSEDFVVVSLYVDDKKALPAAQQYETKDGYPIRTIGNKWSLIEREYYKKSSQPWYVLVDNEGKLLTPPQGYTPEATDYADYLERGLKKFDERKK